MQFLRHAARRGHFDDGRRNHSRSQQISGCNRYPHRRRTVALDRRRAGRPSARSRQVCLYRNQRDTPSAGIYRVTCSPKQGARLAITRMDEVKVVYEGQDISIYERLSAEHFFLQPCSCYNTALTVDCVMRHPKWRLSLQTHKLIDIR